jgi:hypothetical protein
MARTTLSGSVENDRIVVEAGVADVVVDADGEVLFGFGLRSGCRTPP